MSTRRGGTLAGVILLAVAGVVGVFSGVIEENMLALVPQRIRRQVQLFERSPLSQKLIVLTTAPSAETASRVAQDVREKLQAQGLVNPPAPVEEGALEQMRGALPSLFSPQAQKIAEQKLSAGGIETQIARYYEQLFSLQSLFAAQLLAQDPFYLTEIVFNRWAALGQNTQGAYEDGLLSARGGKLRAGLYETPYTTSDLKAAQKLHRFFENYENALPAGVHVFFMGGLRYTLENASVIKRDLAVLSLVGLAGLGGVFFWFFRTKRALLIYALPLLVLPVSAWGVQRLFGHISGITLGFGSVVAGLSVDYAVYIYFALQQTQLDAAHTLGHMRKHLGCTFLTSALCFAALLFSSVEVFKQIAVFAFIALALALVTALYVFPPYFAGEKTVPQKMRGVKITPLSARAALWVSVLLMAFGAWGIMHLSPAEGLDTLNATSAAFAQDKKAADELFASDTNALLFALGHTPDEALANNEKLAARLPEGLAASGLFASAKAQAENAARWQEFWSESRRETARHLLAEQAQQKGFKPDAFEPFWTWLETSANPVPTDFSAWYNPLIRLADDAYAVVNVVPNSETYARVAGGKNAVFVSAAQLQKDLSLGVRREALRVILIALFFNIIAVWTLFKNVKVTLFCFIPVVLGGCLLFGTLALFKVEVNLFGLIFLPLLIGLGIDYAIFQLLRLRARGNNLDTLYPPQALLAAGLSTLVGFGVLVLAQHAVLFIMGLCALVGIGGAVAASLWVLPALWEHYV